MFNNTGIKKVTGGAPQQILYDVAHQMSVSIKLSHNSDAAAKPNAQGRKIVRAGTPLNGDLTNRSTAFKKAQDSSAPAVGVLLHDVDVTDGDNNGTLLIWGFVNMDRLDDTTEALITPTRKKELTGMVTFLKDN